MSWGWVLAAWLAVTVPAGILVGRAAWWGNRDR